jgi:hypothetical protein
MPDQPVSALPRFKTEAVGITQDAGGFVLSPVMSCPRAHASFYG